MRLTGKRIRTAAFAFCAMGLILTAASSASEARVEPRSATLAPRTRTAPAPERRLTVAVISDLNGSYGSTRYGTVVHDAVDRLLERSPDLVLSTGDMVAGMRRGIDHEAMWTSFHAAVSDRLAEASIPFAVTPGNHDASAYPAYAGERSLFVEQWAPRRPDVEFQDETHYPLRYSFVSGPALFVSLDSTTVGALSDEQMRWLDEQLREGAHHPVKIVFGHVPLHPFAEGRENDHIGDAELEALLLRHGVELFVSGHHHAYYPGRRGALRLVSTACLGGGARRLIGTSSRSERSLLFFTVGRDGVADLDAYTGDSFAQRIARHTLPEHVGAGATRIVRDDLVLLAPIRVALR